MSIQLANRVAAVRPDLVWASLIASGSVYEVYALHNGREGYTLSENLRAWFRCEKRVGKYVFTGAYVGFSAWFVPHIIAKAVTAIEDAVEDIGSARR